jgi:16S rRNA (guanine966-N2)-methyltransferase
MRIIAGSIKGRRLQSPPDGDLAIRPTSDRAREALFSILQAWPRGAFVDLFAGTGAVGLEAWSRGYSPVTCVEKDGSASALARVNARGTEVQVLHKDVLRLQVDAFRGLAIVFGDPPYGSARDLFQHMAPRILDWMAPGGILVWETEQREELPVPAGWSPVDSRRYGAARFHFFQAG